MEISIKMLRDIIVLMLDESRAFKEQREDIASFLKDRADFLKGGAKVGYDGVKLDFFEEMELCEMLDGVFGERVRFIYKTRPPENLMRHVLSSGERLSLSVKGPVRGGERIKSNGDVIIDGDVNPSAEIEAAGSIYILGRMRGRAHAGCTGDETSIVFALSMRPEQIQIADIAAFNRNGEKFDAPCAARYDGEKILIEKF